MAEQLLDRILREVRERANESRAAYEESLRLEAALVALGDGRSAAPATPARAARRPPRSRSSDAARAPRGENLRRIREQVGQRPGATAGEIAAATGIARATVAGTLGKLARDGELEKAELPSGRVGYRRATEPAPQSKPEAAGDGAAPAGSEPA